jgi:hypothetical protein
MIEKEMGQEIEEDITTITIIITGIIILQEEMEEIIRIGNIMINIPKIKIKKNKAKKRPMS